MTRSPDRPDTSPTLGELLKEKAEQGVNVRAGEGERGGRGAPVGKKGCPSTPGRRGEGGGERGREGESGPVGGM